MKRRAFLTGLGSAFVALPLLEGLAPRAAHALPSAAPFAIFMRQGNGVQQQTPTEPEGFWPSFAPGAMTRAALASDTDRAVSVLADHADRLTFVRGIRFNDPANGCRHSGGGNQVLTAASVSSDPCNSTLAQGPSIDERIVEQFGQPGDEPLTLYAGRKAGLLDEVLSYCGALDLRGAERSPLTAYKKLFGLANATPAEIAQLEGSRKSVNDLVRSDMQRLLARTDLSKADRERLDLHFSSIRDLEAGISCQFAGNIGDLQAASQNLDNDDVIDTVLKLHCDIITLAVACGITRAATLQIGCGPDLTQYTIDGAKQPEFHVISHRGASGFDNVLMHHKIDMKILGYFKCLLDGLAAHTTPSGPLLDQGVSVYVNDLGTGDHSYENIPYLLAGSAGGFLRTARYVDAGGVPNNKILSTIGAAAGCTNAAGQPLDDFGDPSLPKGLLDAIVASTSE